MVELDSTHPTKAMWSSLTCSARADTRIKGPTKPLLPASRPLSSVRGSHCGPPVDEGRPVSCREEKKRKRRKAKKSASGARAEPRRSARVGGGSFGRSREASGMARAGALTLAHSLGLREALDCLMSAVLRTDSLQECGPKNPRLLKALLSLRVSKI